MGRYKKEGYYKREKKEPVKYRTVSGYTTEDGREVSSYKRRKNHKKRNYRSVKKRN